jgi:hypothetical protein
MPKSGVGYGSQQLTKHKTVLKFELISTSLIDICNDPLRLQMSSYSIIRNHLPLFHSQHFETH